MASRKIRDIVNQEFEENNIKDKNGKILSNSKSTINNYFKKRNIKTRKIKKTFSLNKKQKKQRVDYCNKILKKNIKGENIFFADETKIQLGGYTNDHIRLSQEK